MEEKTGGLNPEREAQIRAWANGSFTPPLQFDRAYALELLAEIDRLRAERRIPPGMTAERLDLAHEYISEFADNVSGEFVEEANKLAGECTEWAKWLREHPAPSGEPTRTEGLAE